MTNLRRGSHVVFSIHLHIVFVTKYRRKVLTAPMIEDMKEVFERVLTANSSKLEDCNGVQLNIDKTAQPYPNIPCISTSFGLRRGGFLYKQLNSTTR